jgi:hypothetical protein
MGFSLFDWGDCLVTVSLLICLVSFCMVLTRVAKFY